MQKCTSLKIVVIALALILSSQSKAQITNKISIILGGSSSYYDLSGGSLLLDSISNNVTSAYCSPSNGMTAVRGGACDIPAAVGADFVTIDGIVGNFPSRFGKTANRPGSSNYFASLNHGTASQQVWICYSAGYYQIVGSTTYDWEYQIRIYKDSANPANDYAKILTLSNSNSISKEEYFTTWSADYSILDVAVPVSNVYAIKNLRISLFDYNQNYKSEGTDMFLDSIGALTISCTPSAGTSVRGGACEMVDTGAWWQPIYGLDEDFPGRISGSAPTPNRPGSSSFFATKYLGTDSAKIWICYSAGADLFIGSSQVYDWEYQIKIFIDSADLSKNYCKIVTIPNSNTPTTEETILNFNVAWDIGPHIEGKVRDVNFNFNGGAGTLDYEGLENVTVTITGTGTNSAFSDTYITGAKGRYFFIDYMKDGEVYDLHFSKDGNYSNSNKTPYTSKIDTLGVVSGDKGDVGNIDIPFSLLDDVRVTADTLKEFTYEYTLQGIKLASFFGMEPYYTGFTITDEETFLSSMEDLTKMSAYQTKDMIESISRLIIVNNCLDSTTQSSEDMVQYMIKSLTNLCIHATSFLAFKTKITNDEQKIIASSDPDKILIQGALLASKKVLDKWDKYIERTIDLYTSKMADQSKAAELNKTLKNAVNYIKLLYNIETYMKEIKEEGIKDVTNLFGTPLLMRFYLDTEPVVHLIHNAIPQAPYNNYTETFNTAFSTVASGNSSSLIEKEKEATHDAKTEINYINYAGTIASNVGDVSTIAGIVLAQTGYGVPIAAGLEGVGRLLKGAQLGTDIYEFGIAGGRWLDIVDDVKEMTTKAYQAKKGAPIQNLNTYSIASVLQTLSQNDSLLTEFYTIADSVIYYMNSNSIKDVARKYTEIELVDSALNESMDESMYPWLNAASYADTIASFDSLYSVSATNYGDFLEAKMAFHFVVLGYLMDTSAIGAQYADSAQYYLYGFLQADSVYTQFASTNSSKLSSVTVSSYLVPSSSIADTIYGGSNFTYSVTIKNYGTIASSNAYAKLELSSALHCSNDSIYIGNLSPNTSTNITFTITADNIDTTGMLSVMLYSSNGKTTASSKITNIKLSLITAIAGFSSIKQNYISCYPNPAHGKINISYIINENENVNLAVYDIYGKEIAMLVNKTQMAGNYLTNLNTENLNSGMYLIELKCGNKTSVSKFIVE